MAATKEVTIRGANQGFAKLIREVEAGQEVVITRRGRPVARIRPIRGGRRVLTPEQEAALDEAERILDQGWDLDAGPLDRSELHER